MSDDNLDRDIAEHAYHLRRLFALMLQVFSGGKGIDDIGAALCRAADSYELISEKIEAKRGGRSGEWWGAHRAALEAAEAALSIPADLQRDTRPEDIRLYDSFAYNVGDMTQAAAKMVAHKMLGHPGNGSRAESDFMESVVRVGGFQSESRARHRK